MATEIKKALCTAAYWAANSASMIANEGVDGYYETFTAFDAAAPTDLVAADEQWTLYCYKDPNYTTGYPLTADENISRATSEVSATCFFKITVPEGHRHNGYDPLSGFYIDVQNNWTQLTFSGAKYTYVEWLSFYSFNGQRTYTNVGQYGTISHCIRASVGYNSTNYSFGTGTDTTVEYCVSIGEPGNAAPGIGCSGTNAVVRNCVAINATVGFTGNRTYAVCTVKNCLAINCGTGFSLTTETAAASGNNATTDATDGGPNSFTNISTKEVVDFAGGDYRTALGSLLTVSGEDDGFIGTAVAPRFEGYGRVQEYTLPTVNSLSDFPIVFKTADFEPDSLNGYTFGSYGLGFDGVDDYVVIPEFHAGIGVDFTVEVSFVYTGNTQILFGRNGTDQGFLAIYSNGTFKARLKTTDTTAIGSMVAGEKYTVKLSRVGTTVTTELDGQSVQDTINDYLTLDRMGKYSGGSYYSGALFGIATLTNGTRTSTYDFNQTSGSVVPDTTDGIDATIYGAQWIPGWSYKSGGGDLRISTDPNGYNEIPLEIVDFTTGANPSVEVHTKVPSLATGGKLYFWGHKSDAIARGPTEEFGSQAVWSDYGAVYHFNEETGDFKDSSGVSGDLANVPTTGLTRGVAGPFGGKCIEFDGTQSEYAPPSPEPGIWHDAFTESTLSVYGELGSTSGQRRLVFEGGGSINQEIYYRATPKTFSADNSNTNEVKSPTTYDPGLGFIAHNVLDTDTLRLMVNGVEEASAASTGLALHSGDAVFFGDGAYAWVGKIFGIRRRYTAITESWATTEYDNQSSVGSWGTIESWEAPTFPGLARYVGYLPKESHPDFLYGELPTGPVEVDWDNELTDGLVALYLATHDGFVELVGDVPQPIPGAHSGHPTPEIETGPEGELGLRLSTGGQYIDCGEGWHAHLPPGSGYTLTAKHYLLSNGTGNDQDILARFSNVNNNGLPILEYNNNSTGSTRELYTGTRTSTGRKAGATIVSNSKWTTAVGSMLAGSLEQSLVVDGILVASNTSTEITQGVGPTATLNIGGRADVGADVCDGYISLVAVHNRGFAVPDLERLSEAPAHLLRPKYPETYYYWDVAANDGIGPGETLTLEATSVAAPVVTPAATIVEGLVLDASTVSVPVDAVDATLDEGAEALSLEPGTVSVPLDAPSATIVEGLVLDANTVGVPVGTPDAEITEGLVLSAGSVGVPVTAPAAALSEGLVLSASTVSVPVQAENATLVEGLQLVADTVDVPVTAPDAQIGEGLVLSTSAVSVPVSTPAAVLSEGLVLNASQIAIPLEATEASLTEGLVLQASGLAVPVDAPDATIDIGGLNLLPNAAAVPVSTPGATLVEGLVLSAGVAAVPVQAPQALYTEGLVLSAGIVPVGVGAPNAMLVEGLVFLASAAEVPIQTYNPTLFIDNTLRLGADAIEIPTGTPAATLTEGLVLLANALAVPTSVENATLVEGLKLIANALGIDLTAEDAVVSFDPPIVYITTVDATFTVRVSETSNPIVKRIGVEVFTVRANGEVTLSQTDTARATISFDDTTVH